MLRKSRYEKVSEKVRIEITVACNYMTWFDCGLKADIKNDNMSACRVKCGLRLSQNLHVSLRPLCRRHLCSSTKVRQLLRVKMKDICDGYHQVIQLRVLAFPEYTLQQDVACSRRSDSGERCEVKRSAKK